MDDAGPFWKKIDVFVLQKKPAASSTAAAAPGVVELRNDLQFIPCTAALLEAMQQAIAPSAQMARGKAALAQVVGVTKDKKRARHLSA